MNAKDRDQVSKLVSRLEALKADVATVGEEIRVMADAEQEKFDNMSEGLQGSEKGQQIEAAASSLDSAASACESGEIDSALDSLGEVNQ